VLQSWSIPIDEALITAYLRMSRIGGKISHSEGSHYQTGVEKNGPTERIARRYGCVRIGTLYRH